MGSEMCIRDRDEALGGAGKAIGGDASLVVWVEELIARPLSLEGMPGDLVETSQGPVVIDHADEPYWVELEVGLALVASDGRVMMRFTEDASTLLSEARPPRASVQGVARQLAERVVQTWGVP